MGMHLLFYSPILIHITKKRSIRIITFTKYYEHTSMLFKSLNIMKLIDLVTFHVAVPMKKFYNKIATIRI